MHPDDDLLSTKWRQLRPNTALPDGFLASNVILCCGEDARELMQAVSTILSEPPLRVHAYRCYQFWDYNEFTLVLTGIGTGCLEPLLWEILDRKTLNDSVPSRLVLIGTAGCLADSGFGKVYLIEGAYPVGSGIEVDDSHLPFRPHFAGLEHVDLPRAEAISTDHYYACSPRTDDERVNKLHVLNPALAAGVNKHWKRGRLIDMETAQFYAFARTYGSAGTQFLAFRGVANLADQFETQCDYAVPVLTEAFRQAIDLVRVGAGDPSG
jgi:hypothetical protein